MNNQSIQMTNLDLIIQMINIAMIINNLKNLKHKKNTNNTFNYINVLNNLLMINLEAKVDLENALDLIL